MAWNKMDIGEIDTLWLMCSTRSQRCDGLSGCLTSCYLITGSVVVENIKGLLEKISYSPHSRMDRVAHPSGHVHDGWAQTTFSSILPCEVCPLLLSDDQKEWCWHPHKKKDHKISGTIFFFLTDSFPTVSQFRERRFTSCFHLGYCSLLVMFSFFFDDRFV